VSWKILLPVNPNLKVLAVFCSNETVTGLRRTYHKVDVKRVHSSYDIIVIGKCKVEWRKVIKIILSCLHDDTIFVCLQPNRSNRILKSLMAERTVTYAPIPDHSPRLFIPLDSINSVKTGLSFHRPGGRRSQLLASLLNWMVSFGVLMPLKRRAITIGWKRKAIITANVLQLIGEDLNINITSPIIYTGSDSPKRKITVLLSNTGKYNYIVKIADTAEGNGAIESETATLLSLSNSNIADVIPRIYFLKLVGNYKIQVQQLLANTGQTEITLTPSVIKFLTELSKINNGGTTFGCLSAWQEIKDKACSTLFSPSAWKVYLSLCQLEVAEYAIYTHICHGDFTPWNIKCTHDGIVVYDWEDSSQNALLGIDIFHFVYRQTSLVGPWQGAASVKKQYDAAFTNVYPWFSSLNVVYFAFACIKEYMMHKNKFIEELLEATAIELSTYIVTNLDLNLAKLEY
jgi:hypothetical protein